MFHENDLEKCKPASTTYKLGGAGLESQFLACRAGVLPPSLRSRYQSNPCVFPAVCLCLLPRLATRVAAARKQAVGSRGNKALESEKIATYDAQLFYNDEKTYAAITYFNSDIKNLIIRSDYPTLPPAAICPLHGEPATSNQRLSPAYLLSSPDLYKILFLNGKLSHNPITVALKQ